MTPWLDDGDVRLYHGDALEQLALMPSESVQCIVTSPPFWGLRDYGTPGQIGLEETPDQWCAKLVAVMREARRVLRSDGVAWVECGDSYNSTKGRDRYGDQGTNGNTEGYEGRGIDRPLVEGCKVKDLVGAPWLLAFALRADGWYLRSDTIWARPNPMPESVTDRPTKAHSYVFLLAKSARYFYDADAIREPLMESTLERGYTASKLEHGRGQKAAANGDRNDVGEGWSVPAGRNARSVWVIPTQPTPWAHFATFPEALVERCVKAGTSDHGCCSECGAPWRRITERETVGAQATNNSRKDDPHEGRADGDQRRLAGQARTSIETTGWEPTCECGTPYTYAGVVSRSVTLRPDSVPCVVLDPFMGSGTTCLVARRLGRHSIGIELNAEYLAIAAGRLRQPTLWSNPT